MMCFWYMALSTDVFNELICYAKMSHAVSMILCMFQWPSSCPRGKLMRTCTFFTPFFMGKKQRFHIEIYLVVLILQLRCNGDFELPSSFSVIIWSLMVTPSVQVHNLKKNIGLFSGFVWTENEVGCFSLFLLFFLRFTLFESYGYLTVSTR